MSREQVAKELDLLIDEGNGIVKNRTHYSKYAWALHLPELDIWHRRNREFLGARFDPPTFLEEYTAELEALKEYRISEQGGRRKRSKTVWWEEDKFMAAALHNLERVRSLLQFCDDPLSFSADAHGSDSFEVADQPAVFIVHGRDPAGYRHQVARLIERATRLSAVILDDQIHGGRPLIDKFRFHANQCAAAVVL